MPYFELEALTNWIKRQWQYRITESLRRCRHNLAADYKLFFICLKSTQAKFRGSNDQHFICMWVFVCSQMHTNTKRSIKVRSANSCRLIDIHKCFFFFLSSQVEISFKKIMKYFQGNFVPYVCHTTRQSFHDTFLSFYKKGNWLWN